MSRAQLFADAVDTLITLGWAVAAWLAVLAAVATVVLFAVTAVGAWALGALWRRTVGPSWRRGRLRARIHAGRATRAPQRRTGLPGRHIHSTDHDYEEAA